MYQVKANKSEKVLTVVLNDNNFTIDGEAVALDVADLQNDHFHILKDNKGFTVEIISVDLKTKTVNLKINGKVSAIVVKDNMDMLLEKMGMGAGANQKVADVKAPMPGLVLELKVKVGDAVEKGSPLLVLEAMKMENVIKSVGDGVVKKIAIEKGQAVEKGEVLLVME